MSEPSAAWQVFNTRQGRLATIGLGTAVFIVVLAGLALACVPWKGEMTVTGQSSGNSLTVHGANDGGMNWCPGDSYPALAIQQNESIKVEVAETTKCNEGDGDNELGDGDYIVSLTEGGFVDDDGDGEYRNFRSDCMPINAEEGEFGQPTYQFDDTFTVTNGSSDGTPTYDMSEYHMVSSKDTPQEAAGICVTKTGGGERQGNMMPITTL